MAHSQTVRAGERARVLWIFSSSIPGQIRFRATPLGDGPLTGKVELKRGRWFSNRVETFALHARNVFDKGMSDGDFRIHVTPDRDCRIDFETRHFRAEIYFRILATVIALGVIAGVTSLVLSAL